MKRAAGWTARGGGGGGHKRRCCGAGSSDESLSDGEGVLPTYCNSRYYKILAGGNSQGGVGCN